MIAANHARGEVIQELGGQQRRLCLTLGALAAGFVVAIRGERSEGGRS
jgi:hypothetical protein